jgi:hypothetical protein
VTLGELAGAGYVENIGNGLYELKTRPRDTRGDE